jgi:FAD/FMN-containing dehydrogenase
VPSTGCVILSMERMRVITPADPASATIVAEAGAVLEAVQRAAEAHDLLFPLDIGGRGSCTIGGNTAGKPVSGYQWARNRRVSDADCKI